MSAWKLGDNCDDYDDGDDDGDDDDYNNNVKRHNRVCAQRPFNTCKESGGWGANEKSITGVDTWKQIVRVK